MKAARIAHDAERDVALTLSDAFCVDRYRAEFLDLIRTGTVDLVFANERELHSLYQTADFDAARCPARRCQLAVVTRSEKGCLVVTRRRPRRCRRARSSAWSMPPGQGDLFAAGFLVGLVARRRLPQLRTARGARRRRGYPASRGAARNLAQGSWRGKRLRSLTAVSSRIRCRFPAYPQAIHSNLDPELPQRHGTVARSWHWCHGLFHVPRRIPMVSPIDRRLPSRFPVGTRYVIEGRGGGQGHLRIHCAIWSFLTAGTSICRSIRRTRTGSRRRRHRPPGRQPKIIFVEPEPPRERRWLPTPGGVPPSPQPLTHPATDPGPFGRRGLLFWCGIQVRQAARPQRRPITLGRPPDHPGAPSRCARRTRESKRCRTMSGP